MLRGQNVWLLARAAGWTCSGDSWLGYKRLSYFFNKTVLASEETLFQNVWAAGLRSKETGHVSKMTQEQHGHV